MPAVGELAAAAAASSLSLRTWGCAVVNLGSRVCGSLVHANGLRMMAAKSGRRSRARRRCGCTREMRGPVIMSSSAAKVELRVKALSFRREPVQTPVDLT
jgi:hypothetical protein